MTEMEHRREAVLRKLAENSRISWMSRVLLVLIPIFLVGIIGFSGGRAAFCAAGLFYTVGFLFAQFVFCRTWGMSRIRFWSIAGAVPVVVVLAVSIFFFDVPLDPAKWMAAKIDYDGIVLVSVFAVPVAYLIVGLVLAMLGVAQKAAQELSGSHADGEYREISEPRQMKRNRPEKGPLIVYLVLFGFLTLMLTRCVSQLRDGYDPINKTFKSGGE